MENNPKPAIATFYPVLVLGKILGFFPVQNLSGQYQNVRKLNFKFWSSPVLYTLILNASLYFFTFETIVAFIESRTVYKILPTDIFALQFFYITFYITRFASHITTILTAPKILRCLKTISNYDENRKSSEVRGNTCHVQTLVRLFSCNLSLSPSPYLRNIYNLILTVVTVVTLQVYTLISFEITEIISELSKSNIKNTDLHGQSFNVWIIPTPSILSAIFFATNFLAELSFLFAQYVITFVTLVIRDRLKEIGDEFVTHFDREDEAEVTTTTTMVAISETFPLYYERQNLENQDPNGNKGGSSKFCQVQLKVLSRKFLSVLKISDDLNKMGSWVTLIFITGSTAVLITLPFLIALKFSEDQDSHPLLPGVFIFILTVVRIGVVANLGETLEKSRQHLKSRIWRSNFVPLENAVIQEMNHFNSLLHNSKIEIAPHGLFKVNLSMLIKILYLVVTFVVVLTQFRMNDLKKQINTKFFVFVPGSGSTSETVDSVRRTLGYEWNSSVPVRPWVNPHFLKQHMNFTLCNCTGFHN